MTIDFKAMAAAAAATAPDMTKASVGGGGEYTPPAAGPVRLRLVGYIETGKQTKKYAGKPDKIEDEVQLVFELSGPKHQPKVLDDGTKIAARITVKLNLSLNEKANFFKLFKRMNYKGTAKHMSELLGEPFRGVIVHNVVGAGTDKEVTFANLRDDSGFTIAPPRYDDPETGETKEVVVAPAVSALRLFIWNAKPEYLKPMWDSLFIDGSYGEGDKAKSKNVLQNAIKGAVNYVGSPIYNLLQAGGAEPDLPDTDEVPAADERDPLDDVA